MFIGYNNNNIVFIREIKYTSNVTWNIVFNNRPFAARGHMVQNPTYWRAKNCDKISLGNVNKEKSLFSSQLCFVLESGTFVCLPVWRTLYDVTSSCKGPIIPRARVVHDLVANEARSAELAINSLRPLQTNAKCWHITQHCCDNVG